MKKPSSLHFRAILLLVLALSSTGYTDESRRSTIATLTLSQAVERALNSNTAILESRARKEEAEHLHSLALSQFLPSLNGIVSAYHKKDGLLIGAPNFGGETYNLYSAQLQLVQPIYAGGATSAGLRSANEEVRIRELDTRILERDTTSNVVVAFYQVLVNQKKVANLTHIQQVEQSSLSTAKRRQYNGRGQLLDVLQIRTQVALLDSKISQAQSDLKTSVIVLMNLLSDRTTHEIELKGSLNPQGLRKLVDQVRQQPYKILEFDRVEALENQTSDKSSFQMAKYWPQINFLADFGRTSNTRSDLFNDYANGWDIGLQLKLPLFNGFASIAEGHQYDSQIRQIQIEQNRIKDQAALEETRSIHELESADAVIRASDNALALAQASVKEANRAYSVSTIDYLQFLTVQQSLLDAQVSHDQAELNYVQALARYMVATGHSIQDLVKALEDSV